MAGALSAYFVHACSLCRLVSRANRARDHALRRRWLSGGRSFASLRYVLIASIKRMASLYRFVQFRGVALAVCVLPFVLTGCGGGRSVSGADTVGSLATGLNDTGRSTCSGFDQDSAIVRCPLAAAPGQDADFGRDALARAGALVKIGSGDAGFDFSKLGSDGMPLLIQDQGWSATGSEQEGTLWSCVLDNTTGLTWEVKHSDALHPRYGLSTYNWYSSDPLKNAGVAGMLNKGSCNTERCDSEGYVAYINSISLCGYSDWRMPTVSEFYSIGHKGLEDPAIDEHYFPNTLGGLRYWTGNTVAEVAQNAWYMYFSDASISFTNKVNASHLRLVRVMPETPK